MKTASLTILSIAILLLGPVVGYAATVSPSVIELNASRGEVLESSFQVLNTGESEQTYFVGLLGFEPSDESGIPKFTESTSTEFVEWIDIPSEIQVPPQSKVDVPFTVALPDDVASGGYYVAITVSTAPSDIVQSNGAIVEAKTAILVLLAVEGETVEQLALLDFSINQASSFLPFGEMIYRVQNQGNVHLTPIGDVQMKGVFGQIIAIFDANQDQGRVLPNSTRAYSVDFGIEDLSWLETAGYQLQHLAMGPVTVDLDLSYGTNGSLHAQTMIWVIPWQLISIVVVLLVVLVGYRKVIKRH